MIISVCCNNAENGLFTGRAVAIEINRNCYESANPKGVKFADHDRKIRMHRKEIKVLDAKDWVGNWCWNEYSIKDDDAKALHEIIKSNGLWYESDI